MPKSMEPITNFLGDASSSDECNDSSRFEDLHESSFRSPQRTDGNTDYGLEFTNTNLGSPLINLRGDLDKDPAPSTTAKAPDSKKQPPTTAAAKNTRKQRKPIKWKKRFVDEVRKLQTQNNLLIPQLPFSRLVREILMDRSVDGIRITRTALEALQVSCEQYVTQHLQDAYTLTLHRGRVTLSVTDMELLRFIRGRF